MPGETVFRNGKIVLEDRIVHGNVVVRDKFIAEVDESSSKIKTSINLNGDYLLPGLVELHTDNFEKHTNPRPGVRWPTESALLAHDAQIIGAGITSVFDAISVGDLRDDSTRLHDLQEMVEALSTARQTDALRADHYLHLRCEVSCDRLPEMFMDLVTKSIVRLISMMDHTPGQRQFLDPQKYKTYYANKWGKSISDIDSFILHQREKGTDYSKANRKFVADYCRNNRVPLASHDDATSRHVEESVELGTQICEFPTTLTAAVAARKAGLEVMVGTPNLVCGGSHSGNVSAAQLASMGLTTALSSDYVPLSLLQGVFLLTDAKIGISLPTSVSYASRVPALAVGFEDRGHIASNCIADLIRVRVLNNLPIIAGVWRNGKRVS